MIQMCGVIQLQSCEREQNGKVQVSLSLEDLLVILIYHIRSLFVISSVYLP